MPTTLRDSARMTTQATPGDVRFVNLTGHPVVMLIGQQTRTFEPDGLVARVEYLTTPLAPIQTVDDNGKPIKLPRRKVKRGRTVNLPEPTEGVFLLVSRIVASYNERTDLIIPDGVRRDSRGQAFGCTYLTEVDEHE